MREIRPYGSVRGAAGNGGPYRDNIDRRGANVSFCPNLSAILSVLRLG